MSFYTMSKSLTGEIPGLMLSLAQNKVAEAIGKVYDESDWSFQTIYAGWLAPGQLANRGTYTVTPYQNTVIADAVATAALAAITSPLITTLQYRDPARAIYNIIGYDNGQTPYDPESGTGSPNYPFATLTLDRPWMEPTDGPGQPYMIYQCYFPAPVKDWRKFIEIRDTTNARPLFYTEYSQADLARKDPQRTCFADPRHVVPCGVDLRPGSATPGYPMYELWPQQLSRVPYSFSGRRRGPELVKPTDTVPYPFTEELVKHRAMELLYLFKEAQKGEDVQRGSGANWLLLAQAARKEYDDVLDQIRAIDANLHNDFVTHLYTSTFGSNEPFANRLGQFNVGGFPER